MRVASFSVTIIMERVVILDDDCVVLTGGFKEKEVGTCSKWTVNG